MNLSLKSLRFRNLLNPLLLRFGYRLTKLSRFEQTLITMFGEKESFVFVQIGANDGLRFDNLYQQVTSRGCSGLVVEPIEDYFETLERAYSSFPMIKAIRIGVHKTDTTATIYRVDPAAAEKLPDWSNGIASLDPDHHKKSGIPSEYIVPETIDCMHLMSLLEKYLINSLDVLQIDVEGYDAEVISMIDFERVRPRLIKFERVNLTSPALRDTRKLLQDNGYLLVDDKEDTIAISKQWRTEKG